MRDTGARTAVLLVLALGYGLLASGAVVAQGRPVDPPVQLLVETNASRVQVGDVFQLDVTVSLSGASVEPEELVLPDLGDFEVVRQERAPTSQRTVVVNGRMSASRTFGFVFHLRATTAGQKTIGPGRARMSGHVSTTKPIVIDVSEREKAGAGGLSSALDPAARFQGRDVPPHFVDARFDRDEAYVGQQVLLTVDVYTTEYVDLDLRNLAPPKPAGFWTEVLETPTRIRPTQRTLNGKTYLVYQVMRVAMFPLEVGSGATEDGGGPTSGSARVGEGAALEKGERVIDPMSVTLLTTGGSWRRRNEQQLISDPIALVVKALPEAGRPPGFSSGNVGHWQLKAEVSEKDLPLGQPFTLKVTAGGEGNLQAVVLPPVEQQISGARVFPPTTNEVKGVQHGRLHGAKSLELLVQPKRPGTFTVPSFTLVYFDPDDAKYKEARSEPVDVNVRRSSVDDGAASLQGSVRITKSARPVLRKLAMPADPRPLYESVAYRVGVAGASVLGLLAFLLGHHRARSRETLDAKAQRRRKERRAALERAREDKDLAAAERTLFDALAERFGDEVRGLTTEDLGRFLDEAQGGLAAAVQTDLTAWLEAAHAARYAPRLGADKKSLFDDAIRLLHALEEPR